MSTEPKSRHLDSEDENHTSEEILDFSKKREDPINILNLSKPANYDTPSLPTSNELSPLDLSCTRKRTAQILPATENVSVKHQRTNEFPKNWNPSNFPFYSNNKSTKDEWNGGVKTPLINVKKFPETSKSLNELSKLGEDMFRNQLPPRQTAWQSHWVNKGSMEKNKEVFKCVWCKSSFHTLAQLTTHMKETSHCNSNAPTTSQTPNNNKSNSDLNLIIKETMPLPRKLVRGQDVWLGKGAEQTRQILKCMWCGQSFRSLAEMTSHMQQTQHYTNIISQEQIISWKSSDENSASSGVKATTSVGQSTPTPTPPPNSQQSHVTAVLTCKVCDQAFSSLKDLSAHMVKNSHYKEHIMRSITESGGRRRQNREKRKKSLPVRKLLELERAQHELNSSKNGSDIKKIPTTSKISCEKCGEKIDTSIFVEHIRLCVGNSRNLLKSALLSNDTTPERAESAEKSKDSSESPQAANPTSTSPSVLNAIEKLIEKSFDSRNRQNFQAMPNPNLGSSILKRLGIDESCDYTKPIVDGGNLNLIRNYQQQQAGQGRHRERSGSESSSRSQTPDRKSLQQQVTPVPASVHDDSSQPKPSPTGSPIKLEPLPKTPSPVAVKDRESPKVSSDDDNGESERAKNSTTPTIKTEIKTERSPSPAMSEKSASDNNTPKSNEPNDSETSIPTKSESTKSLSALSNMFDNLSGTKSNCSENGGGNSATPGSSHPLAALQKLCDYTDRTSSATSTTSTTTTTNPGAILAFTWACNDAVVNNAESTIIKCAFCDTPFISKGAYRHHLSKMHFVKDGNINDTKSSSCSSSKTAVSPSPPVASTSSSLESNSATKTPPNNNENSGTEESPHSKFLKYTELAKQLSSKYV